MNSEANMQKILQICNQQLTYNTLFTPEIFDQLVSTLQQQCSQNQLNYKDWKSQAQSLLVHLRLRAISIYTYQKSNKQSIDPLISQLEQILMILEQKQSNPKNSLLPIEHFQGVYQQLANLACFATDYLTDLQQLQQYFNILLQHVYPIATFQQMSMQNQQTGIAFFNTYCKLQEQIDPSILLKKLFVVLTNKSSRNQEVILNQIQQIFNSKEKYVYQEFSDQQLTQQQIYQVNMYQLFWCSILLPIEQKQQDFVNKNRNMLITIFNECAYHTDNEELNDRLFYNECFNELTGAKISTQAKTYYSSICLQKPLQRSIGVNIMPQQIKIELLSVILSKRDLNNQLFKQYADPIKQLSDDELQIFITALTYTFSYQLIKNNQQKHQQKLPQIRKILCYQQKSLLPREKNENMDGQSTFLQKLIQQSNLINKTLNSYCLNKDTVKNFVQLLFDTRLWVKLNEEQYQKLLLFLIKYLEQDSIAIIQKLDYEKPQIDILIDYVYDLIIGKEQFINTTNIPLFNFQNLYNFDQLLADHKQEQLYLNRFTQQKELKISVLIKVLAKLLQNYNIEYFNQKQIFITLICQTYTGEKIYSQHPIIQMFNQLFNTKQQIVTRLQLIRQQMVLLQKMREIQPIKDFIKFISQQMLTKQEFILLCRTNNNLQQYGYFNTQLLSNIYTSNEDNQQEYIELFAVINMPFYIVKYLIDDIQQQLTTADIINEQIQMLDTKQEGKEENKEKQNSNIKNTQIQKDKQKVSQTQIQLQYKNQFFTELLGKQFIVVNEMQELNSEKYNYCTINTQMPQIPTYLIQMIFTLRPINLQDSIQQIERDRLQAHQSSDYTQFLPQYAITQLLIQAISLYQNCILHSYCQTRDDYNQYMSILLQVQNLVTQIQPNSDQYILLVEYIILLFIRYQQISNSWNKYANEVKEIYQKIQVQYRNQRLMETYQQFIFETQKNKLQNLYVSTQNIECIQYIHIQDISELFLKDIDDNSKLLLILQLYNQKDKFDQLSWIVVNYYLQKQYKEDYNKCSLLNDLQCLNQQIQYIFSSKMSSEQDGQYNKLNVSYQYKQALIETLKFLLQKLEFTEQFYSQKLLLQILTSLYLIQSHDKDVVITLLKTIYNRQNLQKLWIFSLKIEQTSDVSLMLLFLVEPIIYLQTATENAFLAPKIAESMFENAGKVMQICESVFPYQNIKQHAKIDYQIIRIIQQQKQYLHQHIYFHKNTCVMVKSILASLYVSRTQFEQCASLFVLYYFQHFKIKFSKNAIFTELSYKEYVQNIVEYIGIQAIEQQRAQDFGDLQLFLQFLCSLKNITPYISELIYFIFMSLPKEMIFTTQTINCILISLQQFNINTAVNMIELLLQHPLPATIMQQLILPTIYHLIEKGRQQNNGKLMQLLQLMYQHGIEIDKQYIRQLIRYNLQKDFPHGMQLLMQEDERTFKQVIQILEAQNPKTSQQQLQADFVTIYDKIQKNIQGVMNQPFYLQKLQ